MGDSSRIITVKFTADTKGLIIGAELVDRTLGNVGKKHNDISKLANGLTKLSSLGDPLLKMGSKLAVVEEGISAAAAAGTYLKPMIGLVGLLPGVIGTAAVAMGVLKLGSDGIAAAFKGVGDEAKKSVSDTFQKDLAPAAKSTNSLLKALTPSLDGVAKSMSGVAVATLKTANTKQNISALQKIIESAGGAVGNLGAAFGPVLDAIIRILVVATPAFTKLTAGVGGWAQKLDDWVTNVAGDGRLALWIQGGIDRFVDFKNRIKAFVDDIKPVIKNLGGIRLALFDGIGPQIIPVLTAVTGFLKDNPNLALWILGIGAALKILGPIVSGITGLIAAFDFVLDANPITLIVIAIVALIALLVVAFVILWNKSEAFRQFWYAVWAGLQAAAKAVTDWFVANILPTLQRVWSGIQQAVQAFLTWFQTNVVPWLSQTWQQVQDAAKAFGQFWDAFWNGDIGKTIQDVLTFIGDAVNLVFNSVVIGILKGAMDVIIGILKGAWDIVSGVISGALQVIKGIFEFFAGLLTGNWSQMWNGIKDIVSGFGRAFQGIGNGIVDVAQGIWKGIQSALGGVGDFFGGIIGVLKSGLNGLISVANTGIHGINAVTGLVGIGHIPDIPHLALGGTARAGKQYLVGENGPELFTPGQTGRVTDAGQTAGLTNMPDGDVVFMLDGEVFARIAKREILTENRKLRASVKAGSR